MSNWIDNADSYKCPICGYETRNLNHHNNQCPVCGFIADKDKNLTTLWRCINNETCKCKTA